MKTWTRTVFILSLAGFCFSGYMSAVKFFSGTCAFSEPCTYFLGYPACWYGFVMYLAMFVASFLAVFKKMPATLMLKMNVAISALGVIFSGSFVAQELLASRITGTLGLSTCAYGLIFFIAIFVLSLMAFRKSKRPLR